MSEWVQWLQLETVEFSRLQKLEVIKCPKLIGDLPKKVPSIRELVLEECQGVQLEWKGVSSVETLEISGFESWKEFASELLTLTNLKDLNVKKCSSLLSFPDGMMHLNNLTDLGVRSCPKLVFPLSVEASHCYVSLKRLYLDGCESLESFPLGLFPKLQYLKFYECINFETLLIPDEIELKNEISLQFLIFISCDNMVSFPCGGLPTPKLCLLWVSSCHKLKALPEQMHTLLPSLQTLILAYCPEIESFPEGGLPSKLNALSIRDCKKLVGGWRDWGLQTLPSLTEFTLSGDHESEDVVESFPEEGLLPSSITSLVVSYQKNLKSLNKRGLQLLGSLKHMMIWHCPQLESLPEERLPTSLFVLKIGECRLLTPRCRREEGEDWHKIAQVPIIIMNGEAILDQVNLGPVDSDVFRW
ncbi:hypothetical protein Vadar_000069 [Vaccinium darrowii]|uniref:Uncharacterized protein n=1 Tax=Vaccinium darrowii TaxID=229202 RepID=A0ACB7Z9J4_9ERIC|nr:hypothetical protein Vadar_000069 [Vaccinium darrowii]